MIDENQLPPDILDLQEQADRSMENGFFKLAEPKYRQALELLKKMPEQYPLQIAAFTNQLGCVLEDLHGSSGDRDWLAEADDQYADAQTSYEEICGSGHPFIAVVAGNRGRVAYKRGEYADAARKFKRALIIYQTAYKPYENEDFVRPQVSPELLKLVQEASGLREQAAADPADQVMRTSLLNDARIIYTTTAQGQLDGMSEIDRYQVSEYLHNEAGAALEEVGDNDGARSEYLRAKQVHEGLSDLYEGRAGKDAETQLRLEQIARQEQLFEGTLMGSLARVNEKLLAWEPSAEFYGQAMDIFQGLYEAKCAELDAQKQGEQ